MPSLSVDEKYTKTRLDKWLSIVLPEFSRARIQTLIAEGCVRLENVQVLDSAFKVRTNQNFSLEVPKLKPSKLVAQEIKLDIVYEDKSLIIINKQAGLTVHPGAGNPDKTLVNALLAHTKGELSGIGGVERPGIVHRIDKDTSGLLVVAKTDNAHQHLSKQLANRSLSREYIAVCHGEVLKKQQIIRGNIGRSTKNRQKMAVLKSGGREAVTHVKLLKHIYFSERVVASVVQANLETGRTHQIRVHMAHIKHPLVGDTTYSGKRSSPQPQISEFPRQALHAHKLKLIHPNTEKIMEFTAELPADMQALIFL